MLEHFFLFLAAVFCFAAIALALADVAWWERERLDKTVYLWFVLSLVFNLLSRGTYA